MLAERGPMLTNGHLWITAISCFQTAVLVATERGLKCFNFQG
jgi:hypothetical protein